MLENIYICRHAFRSSMETVHWYNVTGTPEDSPLSKFGLEQAQELGKHLASIDPKIEAIFSSPWYRCLQTMTPFAKLADLPIHVEPGFSEYYGPTEPDSYSPIPKPASILARYFDENLLVTPVRRSRNELEKYREPILIPSNSGETLLELRQRVTFTLKKLIQNLESEFPELKTIVICTHAAPAICLGRALNADLTREIRVGCASICHYKRQATPSRLISPKSTTQIGGWDIILNGSCTHLTGGEERNWSFHTHDEDWKDVEEAEQKSAKI